MASAVDIKEVSVAMEEVKVKVKVQGVVGVGGEGEGDVKMGSEEDLEKASLPMEEVKVLEVVVGAGAVMGGCAGAEGGEGAKKAKRDRHCAFCLTLTKGDDIMLCGRCRKRAYCSKECQVADWKIPKSEPTFNGKIHGYGQGHKNWCGLECGEEDLDWKVVPVQGLGMGVVALRDLPPLYRILVEGMQYPPKCPKDTDGGPKKGPYHPAMDDLMPLEAEICAKFKKNTLCESGGVVLGVGLRHARFNHRCENNAAFTTDLRDSTVVVYSTMEIKEGEEIRTCYIQANRFPLEAKPKQKKRHQNCNKRKAYKTPEECRQYLMANWGIVCPPKCPCRSERTLELLEECVELGEYCARYFKKRPILQKYQKVIENAISLGVEPVTLASIYVKAFEYSDTNFESEGDVAKLGRTFLEKSAKILQAVCHPESVKDVKSSLKSLKDLENLPILFPFF